MKNLMPVAREMIDSMMNGYGMQYPILHLATYALNFLIRGLASNETDSLATWSTILPAGRRCN